MCDVSPQQFSEDFTFNDVMSGLAPDVRSLYITSNDIDIVVPSEVRSVLPKKTGNDSLQDFMATKKVAITKDDGTELTAEEARKLISAKQLRTHEQLVDDAKRAAAKRKLNVELREKDELDKQNQEINMRVVHETYVNALMKYNCPPEVFSEIYNTMIDTYNARVAERDEGIKRAKIEEAEKKKADKLRRQRDAYATKRDEINARKAETDEAVGGLQWAPIATL